MGKKILVVDDDLQTVKLVGLVLDRRGYEIIAARNGEQAIEKARTEEPDLVVLDIMMPDVDGYQVSRRLRANPETSDLPILMFSAKTGVQDKVTGFEAGADDFLSKPIHPEELISRVEALLARSSRAEPKEETAGANIVGFLGSKGGLGTTTLVVNAGVALAGLDTGRDRLERRHADQNVALVETRPGMATASFQLGLPESNGLGKVLKQPIGQLDGEFIEAQLDEHRSGLLLLGGRMDPEGIGEPLSADHAESVVRHLGTLAKYVFVDLGVGLDEVNQRLLPHCRHVVVTIEPDNICLTLADRLLQKMNERLSIPKHRIGLLLIKRNRSATSFTKDAIEEWLGHSLMGMIPPAPELAFQASNQQTPMVMMQVDSLVVRQYKTFVDDLTRAI